MTSSIRFLACVLVLVTAATASAAPITPNGTLVPLPGADFGGSGIPNSAVAVTEVMDGNTTITLGLTAHQRLMNPALTNNGAGTFFAGPGSNFGDPAFPAGPGPSANEGSTWNFAYHVEIQGGNISNYNFQLLYDFNPGVGTDEAQHGVLNLDDIFVALGGSATATQLEGSENLMFNFLETTVPGFILAPPGTFDPNIAGQYSFALRVTPAAGGAALGQAGILVNVGDVAAAEVPEPASLAVWSLLAAGGAVMGWRRKRNRG